jgi:hypothetical protein
VEPAAGAYAAAAAIGAVAGLAELVSRYRDAPRDAAASRGGVAYVLFNALVSLGALYLIRNVFPWPGAALSPAPQDVPTLAQQALAAGVGAMALLRSAVVTVRSGDSDVPIGPAAILEIFRTALDRDVDRVRAGPRATEVGRIMAGVSFARAYRPLGGLAVSLLQNIGAEEEARLRQRIDALANQTGRSDGDKALELGLILSSSVGFAVLEQAKALLDDKIGDGVKQPVAVATLVGRLDPATVGRDLPALCLALNPTVAPEDQRALATQVDLIAKSDLSAGAKVVNIGLVIANILGEDTLATAVDLIGRPGAVAAPPPAAPPPAGSAPDADPA